MEYSLIENSMDSLNQAIQAYLVAKDLEPPYSSSNYKLSILLLAHSAELILKELLLREHEILLFEDIDDVKNDKPTTVGFKKALQRVTKICKIDLREYYQYLDELREIRNKVQHYKFTIEENLCNKIIVRSFSSIEHIVINILEKTFDELCEHIDSEQIQYLHEDKDVYEKKKKDISKNISENSLKKIGIEYDKDKLLIVPCPHCAEKYLVEDGARIKCLFCGERFDTIQNVYEQDLDEIISEHMLRELGRRRDKISIYECFACGQQSKIKSENKWICTYCGELSESTINCEDCGEEIPEENSYLAQSYYSADNYHYLCKECAKKLEDSENGPGFEISRHY